MKRLVVLYTVLFLLIASTVSAESISFRCKEGFLFAVVYTPNSNSNGGVAITQVYDKVQNLNRGSQSDYWLSVPAKCSDSKKTVCLVCHDSH
jgi:hypothetical protein